jgi:hypothetical protein
MSFETFCSAAPSQGRLTAVGPPRGAPALGGGDDAFHHIDGNGEADADTAARTRIDRRIDADQPPVEIDERAARIARIDRRIRLNEESVVADAGLRARQRRNDALRHRLADAEGIADRDDEIAHFNRVRIAKLEHRESLVALDLEHGQIRARIAQHDLGFEFAMIRQRDLHLRHPLDDMMIGDDEAGGIDDDARAERLGGARIVALASEEATEDRIVEQGVLRPRLDARGIDVDDRRLRLLDDRREGQMHFAGAFRRDFRRLSHDRRGEKRQNESDRKSKQDVASSFGSADDGARGRRRFRQASAAFLS